MRGPRGGGDRKYAVNDDFLDELGEEQAWFLGLMASDGCVRDHDNWISLSQSGEHGYKMIKYAHALIGCQGSIKTKFPKNGAPHHGFGFTSPKLSAQLAKFGIVPRKSLTYTYPDVLPSHLFYAFIRGYIDGDGCVSVCDNGAGSKYLQVSFVGTKEFTEECR